MIEGVSDAAAVATTAPLLVKKLFLVKLCSFVFSQFYLPITVGAQNVAIIHTSEGTWSLDISKNHNRILRQEKHLVEILLSILN